MRSVARRSPVAAVVLAFLGICCAHPGAAADADEGSGGRPAARPIATESQRSLAGPAATGDERDAAAITDGGVPLHVRAFDTPEFKPAGTPLFVEAVDGRYVQLEYGTDRRIRGAVFDGAANAWVRVPQGGPGVDPEAHSDPVVIDGYLFFRAGTGYTPAPVLFDVRGNRWIDLSKGAPSIAEHTNLERATSSWFAWPLEGGTADVSKGKRADLATGRWAPLPVKGAPAPRNSAAVAACGGDLFVWGGSQAGNALVSDGALLRSGATEWEPLPAEGEPTARYASFAGCLGDSVVVFGGNSVRQGQYGLEAVPLTDGAIFDRVKRRWSPVPSLAGATQFVPVTAGGWEPSVQAGRFVVFDFGAQYIGVAVFDPAKHGWKIVPELPFGEARPGVRVGDGQRAFVGVITNVGPTRGRPPSDPSLGPGGHGAQNEPAAWRSGLAVFDVSREAWSEWEVPHVGPFAFPERAIVARYGPLVETSRGVMTWGHTWAIWKSTCVCAPSGLCPSCPPSPPPEMGSTPGAVTLEWLPASAGPAPNQ